MINKVVILDDQLHIFFRYNPRLIQHIKQIPYPYRKWNPGLRCWQLIYPKDNLSALERFLNILFSVWKSGPSNKTLYQVMSNNIKNRECLTFLKNAFDFPDDEEEVFSVDEDELKKLTIPVNGELRPFQKVGIAFAVDKDSVLIADEMGLGKTVQAIGILAVKQAFPAIVICPASLKLNWAKEVQKWLSGKQVRVYGLKGKLKAEYDPDGADVYVINYDIVSRNLNSLVNLNAQALVLDESHYCKNGKAQRTKAVLKLSKRIKNKILLSGTPILNKPIELWMQLRIMGIEKQICSGGYKHYIYRYCDAQEKSWGLDVSGASNLRELNSKLKATCMIRRKKAQVLQELPAKQRSDVYVELSNRADYDQAEKEFFDWLVGKYAAELEAEGMSAAERIQAALRRAKAVEPMEALLKSGECRRLAGLGKIKAVVEWIKEFLDSSDSEKLVVFASHKIVQQSLLKEFPDSVHIFGDDGPEDRQQAVDEFQSNPEKRLIICSIRAANMGITLTAASTLIFAELDWTPSVMSQAEDRVHRIGQENHVQIYRFIGKGTIDEHILEILKEKAQVAESAVG